MSGRTSFLYSHSNGRRKLRHFSFFSSDTVESWAFPGKAVLLAFVIIATLRLTFYVYSDFFLPVNATDSTREWFVKTPEMNYRTYNRSPKVLVLGTSRTQRLPTSILAAELGVDPDHVLNRSWPANTFFDMLALLRRNPTMTRDLELLIVELVPVQYHSGDHFPENDAIFFRYSTVREKLLIQAPASRARALFDMVLPVWSSRLTVEKWMDALRLARQPHEAKLAYYVEQNPAREKVAKYRETWGADFTEHVLNTGFPSSNPSPILAHALTQIIELVPDECVVVLVRLPYRPDVEQRVMRPGQYRKANDQFKDFVSAQQSGNVHVVWHDDAESLELSDDDFTRDGTHFTKSGLSKAASIMGRAAAPFYEP